MEKSSNDSDKSYSHVLQKVGVLMNFSVAKVVTYKEIEDIKQLIRAVSKDEKEYKKMLKDEMDNIANMHDPKSPVPGIIYLGEQNKNLKELQKSAKDYASKMKTGKSTKKELCYLIATIIKELGLTQEDFLHIDEEDMDEDEE